MAGYVSAGSAVLGAVGHLANLGQFAELGQNLTFQRENVQWARAAYKQDVRSLRLDLLDAIKDDIAGHYSNHAARIDTILIVTTLLFTFALACLQFSDQFCLQTEEQCPHCIEARHPWMAYMWVGLVAGVLIFPFWGLVFAIWCKLRLDRWLEQTSRCLNKELRWALCEKSAMHAAAAVEADLTALARAREASSFDAAADASPMPEGEASSSPRSESTAGRLFRRFSGRQSRASETQCQEPEASSWHDSGEEDQRSGLTGSIMADPISFVDDYQRQFDELWSGECAWFVETSGVMLWLSAACAMLLTALMFWVFLANRQGEQNSAGTFFAVLMVFGLGLPSLVICQRCCHRRKPIARDAPGLQSPPADRENQSVRELSSLSSAQRRGRRDPLLEPEST
eukprot:TRINITY_DN81640_c0_g1_i1.p1 TRINITY_DN81640_c0_g1~~TRINITY_DN81640_c0_g1_i1.p1  ORF type:complete len:407 (-),score=61.23 TRINITY_DN81640_c0_g1_i1:15-1208(-)